MGQEELAAKMAALEQEVVRLITENETLAAKVAALPSGPSTSFEQVAPPALPEPQEFKVEGKKYRFKIRRFLLDGATLLSHEVEQDKALRERIVRDYPGLVENL